MKQVIIDVISSLDFKKKILIIAINLFIGDAQKFLSECFPSVILILRIAKVDSSNPPHAMMKAHP
jgi:flagellar biosynthesis component FlhA